VYFIFAIVAVAFVAGLATYLFGYAPGDPSLKHLGRRQQAVVAAIADAMFPDKGPISLSGTQAGLVQYFDLQFAEVPKDKRTLMALLLVFMELAPMLFGPHRGRFTTLTQTQREDVLSSLNASRFYFLRLCFNSIRAVLCMGYFANANVVAQIGCAANLDPFRVRVAASAVA
jgi:hypothetical protein